MRGETAVRIFAGTVVTLVSIWISSENGGHRLWAASDSRLSDDAARLIDQGVKLFELPVICRAPADDTGDFTEVYFVNTFGLACAGSSLIYQQVQANLIPLLGNLIGLRGSVPSLEDIANFVAAIARRYVEAVGVRFPEGALRVQLVVAGWCATTGSLRAFEMRPTLRDDHVSMDVLPIDLSKPFFAGDRVEDAYRLCDDIMSGNAPGAPTTRAPLSVLRRLIDDPGVPSIGGDVQIGFTVGPGFRRVQTLRTIPEEEPKAALWLNAIRTDELPTVGPCHLGLMGSVSP